MMGVRGSLSNQLQLKESILQTIEEYGNEHPEMILGICWAVANPEKAQAMAKLVREFGEPGLEKEAGEKMLDLGLQLLTAGFEYAFGV